MARELQIKTKRLLLTPMSENELEQRIQKMPEGELRQAYTEMLEGCRREPENRLWYTAWKIQLKKDGTLLGERTPSYFEWKCLVTICGVRPMCP